jgi:hypothetical protein
MTDHPSGAIDMRRLLICGGLVAALALAGSNRAADDPDKGVTVAEVRIAALDKAVADKEEGGAGRFLGHLVRPVREEVPALRGHAQEV